MKYLIEIMSILLLLFISTLFIGTDYYVDKNKGSDAANGLTPATAWETISKVNSVTFDPGDVVHFRTGNIWRETLTVPSSGIPIEALIFELDVISTQTIDGAFQTSSTSDTVYVYWGDGTSGKYVGTTDQAYSKNYGSPGNRKVKIYADDESVLTKYTMATVGANVQFALSDLPSGLTSFYCAGSNTVSGALSDLPSGLTYFFCLGSNTVSGALSDLPSGLTSFECTGTNTISGALSDLSSDVIYFKCYGSNTLSGTLSDLPSVLTVFYCAGLNTVSGALSDLPSGLTYFFCLGSNTVSGTLSDLPSDVIYFYCAGSNTISDFTPPHTWANNFNMMNSSPALESGLSSSEVDDLLISLAAATWGGSSRSCWLAGNNAARTAASDDAVSTLQGKSVNVTTN